MRFYKFRSFPFAVETGRRYEREYETIVEGKIWASVPSDFNDPFDCYPVPNFAASDDKLLKYAQEKTKSSGLDPEEYLQRITVLRDNPNIAGDKTLRDMMRSAFGVLCLTEDPNSMLMWSHYAEHHRGYCLEFDSSVYPFVDAMPVIYSDERPKFDVFDLDKADVLGGALLRKASCWESEREWRMFNEAGAGHIAFPSSSLTAIILGAVMNDQDEAELRKINDARIGWGPVPIKKAQLCGATYKVNIV